MYGGERGDNQNFGLGTLAEFVTTREAWVVDGEFRVVRDVMDFGHEVGEVELQVEVDGEKMSEGEKGVVMEEMDRRVEAFMDRYGWAWERGEAVGKLTAYFEMVRRRGGGV
jgi:thiamine-triphosphatase